MDPDVEKFFGLSLDLLCIAGTDGCFKKVNPAFEQTLGWSEEELLSRPFYDYVHPDDLEATKNEVEKLAQGIPTIRFENRYRCADGTYKHLRWTSQPETESGLLYAIARDVTWQKEIEAELRRAIEDAEGADRAKSNFLASITHEIRTPMSGILGMADLALERTDDPDLRHCLDVIRQSSEALLELINDLLDISKIEAGRIELEKTPFSLSKTFGAAVRAFAVPAWRKQVSLTLWLDPSLPDTMIGDSGRLRQVLVNLIGNAVKFTDRGTIEIEANRLESSIEVAIRDSGIGIPEEQQSQVFERFWQSSGSTARRRGGTGLGLAISAQLVEQMGGDLELTSRLGEGSTFRFHLPLDDQAPSARPALTAAEIEALRELGVLVFDPDEKSRSVISRTLAAWGIETAVVSTEDELQQALAAPAGDTAHRLWLVDCTGPGEDPFELSEQLSRKSEYRVVGLLSPLRRTGAVRRSRSLGLDGYLIKPVLADELQEVLKRMLRDPNTPARAGTQRRNLPKLAPVRVLLVEDSQINQEVIRGLLESRGHTVDLATTGEDGAETFQPGRWDLVLMDIGLPGIDGTQAAIRMREKERAKDVRTPIVAFTAHAGATERRRCREAGMDGFIMKPVRADRLFSVIARHVANRPEESSSDFGVGTKGPVDWDAALAATGGQEELLGRLVGAAREELPQLVERAESSLKDKDSDTLARVAHTLRGSTRYFGAESLATASSELEGAARSSDFARAEKALGKVIPLVDRLLDALAQSEQTGSQS